MASPAPSPAAAARNAQLLGLALALLGAAFFATKGIVIKLAMLEQVDAVTTLTWRMIVAVPIFVTVGLLGYRRRLAQRSVGAPPVLDRRSALSALGVGVLGYYVASYLDFSALTYITAQLDRLILLTYPFFVVAFGAIFFKRRITPAMIVSLLVSYGGIALIFWRDFAVEGDNVLLGSALVFGSAIAYAGYQILAKPLIDRMGAQLFTSIAMSAAGPAVVAHFLATHPLSALAVNGHALLLMLTIGTVSTVLPAYCISTAIGLIGSERTAIVGNISPVVTVGLAIGVLGEAFTPWHAAGTVLVLAGVWLFSRKQKPAAGAPQTTIAAQTT
ncbi:DMT family transporter [Devosia sp.]|uniref:DMT family transporter n=1 Tax=Devosia sp. TaxID=1871048 RepID=UPI00326573CC